MHQSHLELQHDHRFGADSGASERRIAIVVVITALTMAAEIIAGTLFGSMALVADGWHMGTHMVALGISLLAYRFARRYLHDSRFSFGTWKIEILGGYTSAILLGVVGVSMCYASVERILKPVPIHYDQALLVAIIGLLVNIISAFILGMPSGHHDHNHDHHEHGSGHGHHHHDLNMRAAYIHVITDALTSILAIGALFAAKKFAWNFFDPLAGIIGAALILRWTAGLLRQCGSILLDREHNAAIVNSVRETIESDNITKISDLHLWRIGTDSYACIIVLVTQKGHFTIADFKTRLNGIPGIAHTSIELHYFS
jgi:cation diffusion facilitator family transporter